MKCITAQGNHFCIDGQPVMLRGIGVGSWLNLEHYELGIPGWDGQIRQALSERCPGFMDRFTRGFFTEADASYLVSLGLTFIRVPVNHRLFWDEETNTWLEYSFSLIRHLGEICEHAGLFSCWTCTPPPAARIRTGTVNAEPDSRNSGIIRSSGIFQQKCSGELPRN